MVIVFISMGDTFRSRLAEAYLLSLSASGIMVQSAGVKAVRNLSNPAFRYGQALLDECGLDEYGQPPRRRLTQATLDGADMAIFMNREVYIAALVDRFKFPERTFIWNIPDVAALIDPAHDLEGDIPHVARKTFGDIRRHVDELAIYLRRPKPTEMVDILLADGSPTGKRTDIDTIHTGGFWHQGVHAGIYTDDGHMLFEKRSSTMIGAPGLWDMTMGGICTAGESPDQTVRREIREELGIDTRAGQITKLLVHRYNHFIPHYGFHNRSLVHVYLVRLVAVPALALQESEVETARTMTFAEAKRFIDIGYGKYGRLAGTHRLYQDLLQAARHAHLAAGRHIPVAGQTV